MDYEAHRAVEEAQRIISEARSFEVALPAETVAYLANMLDLISVDHQDPEQALTGSLALKIAENVPNQVLGRYINVEADNPPDVIISLNKQEVRIIDSAIRAMIEENSDSGYESPDCKILKERFVQAGGKLDG